MIVIARRGLGGELNQDTPKVKGMHERVTARKMSTEISTSSLLIGSYMRRVEDMVVTRE